MNIIKDNQKLKFFSNLDTSKIKMLGLQADAIEKIYENHKELLSQIQDIQIGNFDILNVIYSIFKNFPVIFIDVKKIKQNIDIVQSVFDNNKYIFQSYLFDWTMLFEESNEKYVKEVKEKYIEKREYSDKILKQIEKKASIINHKLLMYRASYARLAESDNLLSCYIQTIDYFHDVIFKENNSKFQLNKLDFVRFLKKELKKQIRLKRINKKYINTFRKMIISFNLNEKDNGKLLKNFAHDFISGKNLEKYEQQVSKLSDNEINQALKSRLYYTVFPKELKTTFKILNDKGIYIYPRSIFHRVFHVDKIYLQKIILSLYTENQQINKYRFSFNNIRKLFLQSKYRTIFLENVAQLFDTDTKDYGFLVTYAEEIMSREKLDDFFKNKKFANYIKKEIETFKQLNLIDIRFKKINTNFNETLLLPFYYILVNNKEIYFQHLNIPLYFYNLNNYKFYFSI
ncbi:MAG: hypothetical protein N2505_00295 [Endomicrobia bacterium]|nr:hypothetical protein [Endomicrobiia bacterium]